MTTDKTPSQIEVVPWPFRVPTFAVRITSKDSKANGTFDYVTENGAIWRGTEAEALAKKAELEKPDPMKNYHAGEPIWCMKESDDVIGIRLDDGDSGTVYLTNEQAQDLSEQLAKMTASEPVEQAPRPLNYVPRTWNAEDETSYKAAVAPVAVAHFTAEAARPSVPAAIEICEKFFAEQGKSIPSELLARLAASRSEAQPPQKYVDDSFLTADRIRVLREQAWDLGGGEPRDLYLKVAKGEMRRLLAEVESGRAGAPAAGAPIQLDIAVRNLAEDIGKNFISASTEDGFRDKVEWVHTHIKELTDFASRAAVSAEREEIPLCAKHWPDKLTSRPLLTDRNCVVCEWLAGTHTDVAKEEK